MFGLVYDKASDSMKMDLLNESAYTLVRNGMIRVFCSASDEADVDFIGLFGDRELLEFYFTRQAKLPIFGVGQYKFFSLENLPRKIRIAKHCSSLCLNLCEYDPPLQLVVRVVRYSRFST